jgi:hypothetical protein
VDVDKSAIEDVVLEQTSIKAWTITKCISFKALKGMLTLDIDIEALLVQLYNTSSFWTSIDLFTNPLNGEENINLPLPK